MIDTNNLWQELMESPNLDQFLSEHEGNFQIESVCDLLNQLFQKRRISKAALAKQSGMSEVYLPSGFCRAEKPFPEPSFVPLLRAQRNAGGDAEAFEAMRACAALSEGPAGRHHFIRHLKRTGSVYGQR